VVALLIIQRGIYHWQLNQDHSQHTGTVAPSFFQGKKTKKEIERETALLAGRFETFVNPELLAEKKRRMSDLPACVPLEFKGNGKVMSQEDWEGVELMFADVKQSLLGWLKHIRGRFRSYVGDALEDQMRLLKIEPANSKQDADLLWRGIVIWKRNFGDHPVIMVGSGFAKLMQIYPDRAQFELARVAAQSWAPCELQKLNIKNIWVPLLECLEVRNPAACRKSEGMARGWAFSSIIAQTVVTPGCIVPRLKKNSIKNCINGLALPVAWEFDRRLAAEKEKYQ